MTFGKKIQKLRNDNKLTQEQLAKKLYVSRTAVSKWESEKGYPNIETLKDMATLFNITVDELLSSQEIISLAEKEKVIEQKKVNNLIFGLLDIVSIMFIFFPFYAQKTPDFIYSVSLTNTTDLNNNIKILYIMFLSILSLIGISEIILNFVNNKKSQKIFNILSLLFQMISILIFAVSRQTYLTAIMFTTLIIKIILLFRNISNKKDIL